MLGDVPIKDVNKKINQDVKGLDKLPQKAPAPTKEVISPRPSGLMIANTFFIPSVAYLTPLVMRSRT